MSRTLRTIALILTFVCPCAVAQNRHELSLFATHGEGLYHASRGYGVAFAENWTPRFSTKLAVEVDNPEICVGGGGIFGPSCTPAKLRTQPVELDARYHFVNESRWKPYVGGGVHYIRAPHLAPDARAANRGDLPDTRSLRVVGGVEFLLTPSIGVAAEIQRRVGSTTVYDSESQLSAGLTWRF